MDSEYLESAIVLYENENVKKKMLFVIIVTVITDGYAEANLYLKRITDLKLRFPKSRPGGDNGSTLMRCP